MRSSSPSGLLRSVFRYIIITTVGDNVKRLTAAVHQAVERSDVVVFTGGLGPTDDDLTKETVAAALGAPR
jgi:nicotinamide-nucleotide amidase